jgi:hypothetical protein
LTSEFLVLGVASQGGLDRAQFIGRDIARVVLAVLPLLELMVGTRMAGAVFEGVGREFAPFHGGDGGDLLEDLLFGGRVHNVPSLLDTHPPPIKAFLVLRKNRSHTLPSPFALGLRAEWR